MGHLREYRLYKVMPGSADPPWDACRTLPDGDVIYKLYKKSEVAANSGMTAEEMKQYIKENYPELNETEL